MSEYRWKPGIGSLFRVTAKTFATETEKIRKARGYCTAEDVVQHATPDESPLHEMYDWDDAKEAHFYRVGKARQALNSYIVVVSAPEGEKREIRGAVLVPSAKSPTGRSYEPTREAVKLIDNRRFILRQLYSTAQRWRKQYEEMAAFIEEYGAIASAIDQLPSLEELESRLAESA